MEDLKRTINGHKCCQEKKCGECPYKDEQDETYPGLCEHILQMDALILLQEPRKTRGEVLMAIVSALGYTDVEVFKQTVESTNDTDDYFLGGMYRAVKAVEELFDKDSDHE